MQLLSVIHGNEVEKSEPVRLNVRQQQIVVERLSILLLIVFNVNS